MRWIAACLFCIAIITGAMAAAATGEEVYKSKCSICHDGGAGNAPRIGNHDDWAPRFALGRQTLYATALDGKPDTAMLAKGGFSALSATEVRAAVDYLLAKSGYDERAAAPAPTEVSAIPVSPSRSPPAAAEQSSGDARIAADVAAALLKAVAPPGAALEIDGEVTIVRGAGIKITTRDGVVTLTGTADSAEIIRRAEAAARTVPGVRAVENKLISAALFQFD